MLFVVQQDGLQVGAQHGFHRQLPTRLNAQAGGQRRTLIQLLRRQPLGRALARIEGCLLQRLKGSQATLQALQFALGLLLGLTGLQQLPAQLLQTVYLQLFGSL